MAQKTPVSLMNELAKTNKLSPEYKLVEESGPAHKRTFRVQLTLGDVGTWEGKASSIKQARHAAAKVGLEECGLCIHEKKPKVHAVNLTPTVQLNGLAMKLGKQTQYRDLQSEIPFQPPMNYHGRQMQGMHRPQTPYGIHLGNNYSNYQHNQNIYQRQGRMPRIFCVSLTVGDQVFVGEGPDKQKARHQAASKAIKVLQEELATLSEPSMEDGLDSSINIKSEPRDKSPVQNGDMIPQVHPTASLPTEGENNVKSEISLVYEIATKRKMPVKFEDVSNNGPAHMKNFVVLATVGDFVKEGEGSKKKDAKKDAAKKILEELAKLTELPRMDTNKKPGRFTHHGPHIFRPKPKGEIDPSLNPISILGQIIQKAKESSPVYTTVQDKSIIQGKDFVIQVTVGNKQASGTGRNKKEAKKNAAEAMLQQIGFRSTPGAEGTVKPCKEEEPIPMDSSEPGDTKHVHTIFGRQLKPGLLPMVPEVAEMVGCDPNAMINTVMAPIAQVKQEPNIATVDVEGGLNRAPGAPVVKVTAIASGKSVTLVQKLIQLAEMKGLRVQFTDYPKDNNTFLTLVTISCVPPLNCYGSGVSVEGSREEAASNALKQLPKALEEDQGKQGVITNQPPAGVSDEIREHSSAEVTSA